MKKLVSTRNMDRETWLQYRRQGIGGSDAGAICGLNPYRSAMQVYEDKVFGSPPEPEREAMRQGRDLEDYVAQRFMEASGKKVRRSHAMYQSRTHPFMLADVDRLLVGERAGLECKTASPWMAAQWEDGKAPLSYQIQCYHYMAVCELDAWYLAVLLYGKDFRFYRLERDEGLIRDLIRVEQEFWERYVQARIMPPPDGSPLADRILGQRYRKSRNCTLPLTGFDEKLCRRQKLNAQMEMLQKERRQIEQDLKQYLGEAEAAENDHFRVVWKPVCSHRLDDQRLKREQPELYQRYQKIINTRRLTIQAL